MAPKYPTGWYVLVWCNTELGTNAADAFRTGDIGRLGRQKREARRDVKTE